jgi:DNA invertase Pin-like site-specific DNA recombinase
MTKEVIINTRATRNDDGTANARQLATCREWAKRKGAAVNREYSEIMSGPSADLPELAQAITEAAESGVVLICVEAARLARDVRLFERRWSESKRRGVFVIRVSEGS